MENKENKIIEVAPGIWGTKESYQKFVDWCREEEGKFWNKWLYEELDNKDLPKSEDEGTE